MAVNIGTLKAVLTADTSGFKQNLGSAEKAIKKVEGSVTKLAKTSGIAFAGLIATITKSVRAFDAIDRASKKMEAALRGANEPIEDGMKRATDFAETLQKLTRFSDDAALSSLALARSMGFTQGQAEALTISASDLATGLEMNLNTAIRYISRSAVEGSNLLARYGVALSDTEQKAFDSGTANERLALMLDVVNNRFGGLAEEAGTTAVGAFVILRNEISNVTESFGSLLDSPVAVFLRRITHIVKTTREALAGLNGEQAQFVAKMVLGATAVTGIAFALGAVALITVKLIPLFKALAGLVAVIFSLKTITIIGAVALALGKVAIIAAGIVAIAGSIKRLFDEFGPALVSGLSNAFTWIKGQLNTLGSALDSIFSKFQELQLEGIIQRHGGSQERLGRALRLEALATAPFDPERAGIINDVAESLRLGVSSVAEATQELHARLAGRSGFSGMVDQAARSLGVVGQEFVSKGEEAGDSIKMASHHISEGIQLGMKETWASFKSLLPEEFKKFVGSTAGGIQQFFKDIFADIDLGDLGAFGKEIEGLLDDLLDASNSTNTIAEALAQARARLDTVSQQISARIDAPETEIQALQDEWGMLATELIEAGKAAGYDVSMSLEKLSAFFTKEIEKATNDARSSYASMMQVIRGEMSREEAGIRRELARTVESIEYFGKALSLSETEIDGAITDATKYFTAKIKALSVEAVRETEAAFDVIRESMRQVSFDLMRTTGVAGQLARSLQRAIQTGDPVAGAIIMIFDILSRSAQFETIVQALDQALGTIIDVIGVVLEPLFGAFGYQLQTLVYIFQALEPLFRVVGEILSLLFVPLVLFGMLLQAMAPILLMLGEVLTLMLPALELLFMVLFYVLKAYIISQLALWIGFMEIFNAVVSAIQWVMRTFAKAIGWLFSGTAESIKEFADSLDAFKADTETAVQVLQDIIELSWDDAKHIIAESSDWIQELGKAAETATESLLNVPRGFRIGRARWLAQDPVERGALGSRDITIPDEVISGGNIPERSIPGAIDLIPDKGNYMQEWEIPQPNWWAEMPEPKWLDKLVDISELLDAPGKTIPDKYIDLPHIPRLDSDMPIAGSLPVADGIRQETPMLPEININIDRLESSDPKKFITEMEKLASRKSYAKTGTTVPTAPPFSMGR